MRRGTKTIDLGEGTNRLVIVHKQYGRRMSSIIALSRVQSKQKITHLFSYFVQMPLINVSAKPSLKSRDQKLSTRNMPRRQQCRSSPDSFWDHASVRLPGVLQTNVGHSNFLCVIKKNSYHLTQLHLSRHIGKFAGRTC